MTRKRSAASRARRRKAAKARLAAAGKAKAPAKAVAATPADDAEETATGPHPALEYLQCWRHDRDSWKFAKNRQSYLLKHAFDAKKVPKEYFSILVKYVEGISGQARQRMVDAANAAIRELEELNAQAPEPVSAEDAEADTEDAAAAHALKLKVATSRATRARRILKHLGEADA